MNVDSIKIEELDGEQREIAECIGIESYLKLVRSFGGMSLYLPKEERLLKNKRDKEIRETFNGYNYKLLARKFKLSENRIREIINEDFNLH